MCRLRSITAHVWHLSGTLSVVCLVVTLSDSCHAAKMLYIRHVLTEYFIQFNLTAGIIHITTSRNVKMQDGGLLYFETIIYIPLHHTMHYVGYRIVSILLGDTLT